MAKLKKNVQKTKKVEVKSQGSKAREIEIPVSDNTEIQDGVQPKGNMNFNQSSDVAIVGLSLGATINMGDFQSARVDVFIQRPVANNDEAILQAQENIAEILHDELQRQSELISGE